MAGRGYEQQCGRSRRDVRKYDDVWDWLFTAKREKGKSWRLPEKYIQPFFIKEAHRRTPKFGPNPSVGYYDAVFLFYFYCPAHGIGKFPPLDTCEIVIQFLGNRADLPMVNVDVYKRQPLPALT